MFDIFYLDKKPNLFLHEQKANSIDHARYLSRTRFFWIVNYLCDYTQFDFLWEPVPWQSTHRHAWASQWQKDCGTYLIPKHGFSETNYRNDQTITTKVEMSNWSNVSDLDNFDYTWHPDATDPPYIYQFGTQWQKTGGPVYTMPGATEIKYATDIRAVRNTVDAGHWHTAVGSEYLDFDYTWHPDATDPPYIYQFGTQWQKTGGPVYTVPGASKTKYVKQSNSKILPKATAIVEIDHLDGNAGHIQNTTKQVRYFNNYRDTLIRIAKSMNGSHEYVWICSSICDYQNFDFSWHPEQWQSTMLHVFASNDQKFGDTFFMHVPTFVERISEKELLDWYDINYIEHISVERRPIPRVLHSCDSHVDAVKQHTGIAPLTLFTSGVEPQSLPTVSLWQRFTKTIVPLNQSASAVIVPREAISVVKTQLYDYPYINKTSRTYATDCQMDVIFISNGEPVAEQNWQNLLTIFPNAKHSAGINGRESAYKAAALMSSTPWFYAVFAKTEVYPTFKFDFQPDWMQQPKHYIFHSRNPLNNLEYGAMNINLYNRNLVLTTQPGIDFTLSAAHEVVPMCISVSRFNTDPWLTWRSAFREVLKLKLEVDQGADIEIQYRLRTWLTVANGDNAEWCLLGGQDAIEYYNQVQGDYEKLKLSFEWQWLQDYYYGRYQHRPWLKI
jgi:hypothetical protein